MLLARSKIRITRGARGLACIEIGISAFLMIVLAAFGLDLTLIMIGMDLNDSACRNAARAAAQQSTAAKALQAAQAEMPVHDTGGNWITRPVLKSTANPDFVYNDFSGHPPVNVSPYVTVTTLVSIKCPAPIFFFGAPFLQGGVVNFARRYTFPIIKQKFYG